MRVSYLIRKEPERRGIPLVTVWFQSEVELNAFKLKLENIFNRKVGSTSLFPTPRISSSGIVAQKMCEISGVDIPEVLNWQGRKKPFSTHLTDSAVVENARKFKSKLEWLRTDPSSYWLVMVSRRHLIKDCNAHMVRIGEIDQNRTYQVYAYEFLDKTAYVGLTYNPRSRHSAHKRSGPVFNYFKEFRSTPALTEFASGLSWKDAGELEDCKINEYKRRGFKILNKRKGGGLGSSGSKYTYEIVLSLAKKFADRSSFHKAFSGPYQTAQRLGWINKIADELGWKINRGRREYTLGLHTQVQGTDTNTNNPLSFQVL